jgi:acyl dehydratase
MEHLYFEDLHIGQRFRSGTHVMEEATIKNFAAEFDPQPPRRNHGPGERL